MNKALGSVSNQDDDGDKIGTNLHMWQLKTQLLHALHVHFSQPFLLFPLPELICCAFMWTTGAHGDKFSILVSYLQTADTNLIPGYLECILLAYWLGMTWLSSTSLLNLLIVSYLCDTHYNSIVKKWNSISLDWNLVIMIFYFVFHYMLKSPFFCCCFLNDVNAMQVFITSYLLMLSGQGYRYHVDDTENHDSD